MAARFGIAYPLRFAGETTETVRQAHGVNRGERRGPLGGASLPHWQCGALVLQLWRRQLSAVTDRRYSRAERCPTIWRESSGHRNAVRSRRHLAGGVGGASGEPVSFRREGKWLVRPGVGCGLGAERRVRDRCAVGKHSARLVRLGSDKLRVTAYDEDIATGMSLLREGARTTEFGA